MTDRTDAPDEPGIRAEPKNPRPAETHEGPAVTEGTEDRRPPLRDVGAREWVRENLFGSATTTALTIVFGAILAFVIYRSARFVFVTGRWEVVEVNLTTYLIGRFPRSELWRPVATLLSVSFVWALWLGTFARRLAELETSGPESDGGGKAVWSRVWPFIVMLIAVLSFTRTLTPGLITAGAIGLMLAGYHVGKRLPTRWRRWTDLGVLIASWLAFYLPLFTGGFGFARWGGLLMTLFATVVGIGVSFPIGIALALGRRSKLPAVRVLCVGYIELIRGVPLITLLLMGSFVIGFVFPPGWSRPSLVARGLIAIVAFTAAYLAEIVRGGLQSVPRGQIEAAQAVGLSPWKVTRLVVLPQALRTVIPAIVGQFISLFKDTSLLAIIGVFELLRAAQVVTNQPAFQGRGLQAESLGFAAFLYWVLAYAMSKESQRLERRLGVGER